MCFERMTPFGVLGETTAVLFPCVSISSLEVFGCFGSVPSLRWLDRSKSPRGDPTVVDKLLGPDGVDELQTNHPVQRITPQTLHAPAHTAPNHDYAITRPDAASFVLAYMERCGNRFRRLPHFLHPGFDGRRAVFVCQLRADL